MSELLPCPFCGGEADVGNDYGKWYACCSNHDECEFVIISGPHKSREEAVEVWNTRAELTCGIISFIEHVTMDEPDAVEFSCGHDMLVFGREIPNYCPNCGAKVVE